MRMGAGRASTQPPLSESSGDTGSRAPRRSGALRTRPPKTRMGRRTVSNRRLETALRAGRVSATFAPLLPQLALVGADPRRRQQLGERLRGASDRLGGLFPWIAELLAGLPTTGEPSITTGLRSDKPLEYGPFATSKTNPTGDRLIRANSDYGRAESDIELLGILLNLLAPITGRLRTSTVDSLLGLLRTQVSLEASLQEEAKQRRSLGMSSSRARIVELTPLSGTWWQEQPPEDLEKGPSHRVLERIIMVWSALVVHDEVVPARMDWVNCGLDRCGELVILGRLAGTVAARDVVQSVVSDLHVAQPPQLPMSLVALLAEELQSDVVAASQLAETIMHWVDREAWRPTLGAVATLRLIDRSSDALVRSAFRRDTVLLLRQLALFRTMADDVGFDRSYFSDSMS